MNSVMSWFTRHSVALHDAGVHAGMNAARQGGERHQEYLSHLRLINGIYGVGHEKTAFSEGFVAGYNAIRSGVMF